MGRVSDAKKRLMEAMAELIWVGSYGTTTIDLICDKAGVKKGSFYYFFESKSELAVAAIQNEWASYKTELDAVFSPTVPPMERLARYCESGYREQLMLKEKHGFVLGCPVCTLGGEISTLEPELQRTINGIMDHLCRYVESAIRDAAAAGLIQAPHPPVTARMIFSYMEGVLARARIRNELEVLREIPEGISQILGVTIPTTDLVPA